MSVIDSARIGLAVARYDFWLDLKGVPGKKRRMLRQEMRANLTDAGADLGAAAAVERLGSVKVLAAEAAEAHRRPDRPAWTSGWYWALVVYVVALLGTFLATTVWADAVVASGVRDREVSGSWTFLPGVEFSANISGPQETPERITIEMRSLVHLFVWPLIAFLLGSRIWRLVTGRRSGARNGAHGVTPVSG